MSLLVLILVPWLTLALLMAALWGYQKKTRNAGIVDVAWSFGTALTAIWFAWGADGDPERRILVGAIAGIWGFKLGYYLVSRLIGAHEDRRYEMLREKWGDKTQQRMFIVFQIQAFWAVLFALPMLLASSNESPDLVWSDWLGLGIWLVSVVGTGISDAQLNAFRKDPDNAGKVCRRGLWRYSRHPNYFFEWIHWWAYVAIAFSGEWGWLSLLGPAVMLYFLLKVTGIPITEKALVQSRGDAYREYQRTTSAFVPLPPKEEHHS
jgi:steroid 5-alpha reductase family enzyme